MRRINGMLIGSGPGGGEKTDAVLKKDSMLGIRSYRPRPTDPFNHSGWIFEMEWNGVRALAISTTPPSGSFRVQSHDGPETRVSTLLFTPL